MVGVAQAGIGEGHTILLKSLKINIFNNSFKSTYYHSSTYITNQFTMSHDLVREQLFNSGRERGVMNIWSMI